MTSLSTLSIERLREIYTNTFGVFPRPSDTHYNNKQHYIALFEREIKFGRKVIFNSQN